MNKLITLTLVAAAALSVSAREDFVISAATDYQGVTGVYSATCERTREALVFTEIAHDMQVTCQIPAMAPAEMEALEFRYRLTGPTARQTGGELFYAPLNAPWDGHRRWRIPPLKADGEWHVVRIDSSSIENKADWFGLGVVNAFRFDPTNASGGRLEVSEIRFKMRSATEAVAVSKEKVDGVDVWPAVKPEVFKSNVVPQREYPAVAVEMRGGTALPRCQTAGRKIRLRYDFRGARPTVDALPVTVLLSTAAGEVCWDEKLVLSMAQAVRPIRDDVWSLEFDYELPLYLASGEFAVSCFSPCLRATKGTAEAHVKVTRVATDPAWPTPLKTGVSRAGDVPCFTVNGVPTYALWGTVAYGRRAEAPARHSSAPLNFVTVWAPVSKWWPQRDVLVTSELDRLAEQHRRANPNACFMWDLSIYPPLDWQETHSDEIARDEQGRPNGDTPPRVNFSFASERAYADMEAMLRRVIAYLEQSPYANRIAGYRVNSGHTVEWLGWHPSRPGTILDFSPVAKKGFEAFVKEHYPWVTDYSIPTRAEREALDADGELLWNGRAHARTIAFHDFYSTVIADGAIRMCREAKRILGGRKLVGTYYGYTMYLNIDGNSHMRAHYALKHFLESGAVDFLMSPHSYASASSRLPGTQIMDMKPFRTLQNHGIVSVIEDDTRTHNIVPTGYSQTLTEQMTVDIMRRNMGMSICRNQPFYTYAITSGCEFDFPRFAEDATTLAAAGAYAVKKGMHRPAQIAVVVSEEAIKSTPLYRLSVEMYDQQLQRYRPDGTVERFDLGGQMNSKWIYGQIYTELGRIGAAVDYVLAEDLVENPGDYRLYIMQSCSKATPLLLKAAEKLRERDCTILWTYAPGYTTDEGKSVESMKALTGMDFKLCSDVTSPGVTLADGSSVGGVSYPKGKRSLSPIFAAANPDKVRGRYSNGAAGLAESRTGRARTVFSGSYVLRAPLMRTIAREAGVHLFSDTLDILEANDRFVAFHARNAGHKKLTFPKRCSVVDVFNRRLVARDVECYEFDAPLHSSWLFYYGDDAEGFLSSL